LKNGKEEEKREKNRLWIVKNIRFCALES